MEKEMNISLGFSMDIEKILNYLVENNMYMNQFNNITIRYLGNKEDTANGNRQIFEIERKI